MSIVKNPDSDPSADDYVERHTVTLTSGNDTNVSFDRTYDSAPDIWVTTQDGSTNTVAAGSITTSQVTVSTGGTSDTDVAVLVIGN